MSTFLRRDPAGWVSPLSRALAEALPRLYGEPPDALLGQLIGALTEAMERGELAVDLADPPPEGVEASEWPEAHLQALERSAIDTSSTTSRSSLSGRSRFRRK